jgi:hypothetical protein
MPYYQKESTCSNAIPIKIPMTFCIDIQKAIVKYMWKHTRSQIAKVILNKKFNTSSITTLDFKLYYRAIITTTKKPVWYWHKNRWEDERIRTGDPNINP